MALTDTTASKKFIAGAPNIILKGDYRRKKPEMKMASMNENEKEFMRLIEEFMEQGFSQQEAIDAAREEFDKKAMAYGGRAQYGLGSFVKKIGKGIKGAVKGVGSLLKSPAGLLALNFAPMLIPGGASTFLGGKNAMFNIGSILGLKEGAEGMNALKIGGAGALITGLLSERERQEGESDIDYAQRRAQVNDQLKIQFSRLYPKGENETPEDYDVRINALVEGADDQTIDVGNMAEGGRVGRAFGSDKLVEQASGIEGLPINVNSKGVKELDMRKTGGFIPPVGVKEKADDIPAMLSNNEFVFTADAVRAAGGGSVNKGAQRMYDLMKNLESKVV